MLFLETLAFCADSCLFKRSFVVVCVSFFVVIWSVNVFVCCSAVRSFVVVVFLILKESATFTDTISFCNAGNTQRDVVDIIYDKLSEMSYQFTTECVCSIMSSGNLLLEYVDVRLQKGDNARDGTNCSSAILNIDSNNDIQSLCSTLSNEEVNFRYNDQISTKYTNMEVKLANLYKTNELDAPQMVWIRVSGEGTSLFLVVSVSIKRFPLRFGHVTCKKNDIFLTTFWVI